MRIFIFLALSTLSVNASSVSSVTGNDLLEICENEKPSESINCLYYIIGLSNAHQTLVAMMELGVSAEEVKSWYCIPSGVNTGQVSKVLVKYLENHPELLHHDGYFLLIKTLRSAFPCPNQDN